MSFKKNKYILIKKVVSKELATFLYNYLLIKRQVARTLVRTKYISRIKQKQIASYLNTYIRMPGGCIGSYLVFKDAFQPTETLLNRILLAFIIYCNSL